MRKGVRMLRWSTYVGVTVGVIGLMSLCNADAAEADKPATAAADAAIRLLSPKQLEVVQRETKSSGRVIVTGRVKDDCDKVEVRFSGKDAEGRELPDTWQPVAFAA